MQGYFFNQPVAFIFAAKACNNPPYTNNYAATLQTRFAQTFRRIADGR